MVYKFLAVLRLSAMRGYRNLSNPHHKAYYSAVCQEQCPVPVCVRQTAF